jgi:TctA family transporter
MLTASVSYGIQPGPMLFEKDPLLVVGDDKDEREKAQA